jgi:hypothetical protein
VRTRIFHIPFIHDDPIVGSKPVALCINKSPFVVFDGFFCIYFAHTTGWPLLKISRVPYRKSNIKFQPTTVCWVSSNKRHIAVSRPFSRQQDDVSEPAGTVNRYTITFRKDSDGKVDHRRGWLNTVSCTTFICCALLN